MFAFLTPIKVQKMETPGRPILLTTKDAQELVGVSANTLRDWRKQGLPFVLVGSQPRYLEKSIIEWLTDKQIANVSAE